MNQRSKSSSAKPGAVAFTGHMMDKVGRVPPHFVPRFPREMEDAVTQAIREAIDRLEKHTHPI